MGPRHSSRMPCGYGKERDYSAESWMLPGSHHCSGIAHTRSTHPCWPAGGHRAPLVLYKRSVTGQVLPEVVLFILCPFCREGRGFFLAQGKKGWGVGWRKEKGRRSPQHSLGRGQGGSPRPAAPRIADGLGSPPEDCRTAHPPLRFPRLPQMLVDRSDSPAYCFLSETPLSFYLSRRLKIRPISLSLRLM